LDSNTFPAFISQMNKSKTPIAHQLKALYYRKKLLQTRLTNGELLKRREGKEVTFFLVHFFRQLHSINPKSDDLWSLCL